MTGTKINKMKLAAVVILYYPDESVLNNISSYINEVDTLYIYDNSPINTFQNQLHNSNKIKYHWDGENEGIAKRLNSACKMCLSEGYDHILTMDQDTAFENKDLVKYKSLIEGLPVEHIGMYGVLHDRNQLSEKINSFEINHLLITSGSILPIKIINEIGYFNEDLFIDGVDTEYCLRIFENKYKTVQFTSIILFHNIGIPTTKLTPSLKFEKRVFHSPVRAYYITRNYFYLRKIFIKQLHHLKLNILLNEFKNGVLYGNERLKYIYYALRGYVDYKRRKMGKICH